MREAFANDRSRLGAIPGLAVLTGVLLLGGCGGGAGDLEGTYALTQFGGRSLPIDQGPLPRLCRPPGATCDPQAGPVCNIILSDGTLSLDPVRKRFDIFYATRDSCDGHALSISGHTGVYEVRGDTLTFRQDGSNPVAYPGQASGDLVLVDFFREYAMRFARSPAPEPPLMAGQFNLVDRRRLGTTAGACDRVIEGGALSLEPAPGLAPATGRFTISYRLRNPCPGQPAFSLQETGTYEQVVGSLVFVAQLAPNVVHPFRGTISGTDLNVTIFGDDLVFRR